ncbi:MAG: ATP-binding protein [Magnetococcus sp. DMHC-6]
MQTQIAKILIVDDSEVDRFFLSRMLKNLEAQTVLASSAAEALSFCRAESFALLLLDVLMPNMDGYELAEQLKKNLPHQRPPIIFLTATQSLDASRHKGYEAGAVDFLSKPVDPFILMAKVQIFLDLFHQKQTLEFQKKRLEIEILERKRVEEQLLTAKRKAETANIAKSRFLATISHETRTPLNGVIGFAQLLGETALTEEQRGYLETIAQSGQNLLIIFNDMLDYSRIEHGTLVLEKKSFHLRPLLQDMTHSLEIGAHKKGLALFVQIFPETPLVLVGDPIRLQQILFNLMMNAIKFTAAGHVALFVKQEESSVENQIKLCFLVDDTGSGIPSQATEELFVPFTQVDNSTTRKFGGTGLGLAIAAKLAHLMNGSIELETSVGKGSSFRLKICFDIPFF